VQGAFTGASEARSGLVREAQGGTLFLDEVDALPYNAQAKLLRFLQDKTYRAVGSSKPVQADVRILAASNQDLAAMVERGGFRRDLYFRLNVLSVTLPPLRERHGDIPLLARHFVQQVCHAARRPVLQMPTEMLAQLGAHDWPGNVRELRHAIERAVLMTDVSAPAITPSDIWLAVPSADDRRARESFQSAKARVVEQFERHYIEQLLSSCEGNVTRAAKLACKNRRAFFELMRKHRILPEHFRQRTGSPQP
jgi:two-component system response regulator GlrR